MTSNNNDTLTKVMMELGLVLRPLESALSSPHAFMSFMQKLGWETDDIPQPLEDLGESAIILLSILRDSIEQGFKAKKIIEVKGSIDKTIKAIKAIESAPDVAIPQKLRDDNFKTEFPKQLIEYLLSNYLIKHHSGIGSFLKALGVLKKTYIAAQGNRVPYIHYYFDFAELPKILDKPDLIFRNAFGWGTPDFDFDEFSLIVENLFSTLGTVILTDYIDGNITQRINSLPLSSSFKERSLKVVFFERQRTNGERMAAEINLLKLPATNGLMSGFALMPKFNGVNAFTMQLSPDITLTISSQLDLQGGIAVLVRPDIGISLLSGFNNTEVPSRANASFNVRGDFEGNPNNPVVLVGSPTGSQISFQGIGLSGGIELRTNDSLELLTEFQLKEFKIVINFTEGDGFIQKIIPLESIETNADLTLGFSNLRGIYFSGSGSVEISIPTHITLGPLEINNATLGIKPEGGGLPLSVGLSLKANLGPLKVVVENIGLNAKLVFPPKSDFLKFDIGFKPPNGVGLSVEAAVVKGGGYLFFDFDREEYAGVLQLSFSGIVTITAIGMITTKMPDGSKGFSLFILMSVEFTPGIQLGFGFTILGFGGMIGLNRTVRLDALAQGVRSGTINNIMFPQGDIIANAPRIISDLRAIFPPEEGKFLIGPMIKMGWGTPTLISLSLGVIIEIPGNIAILGVLRVILPDLEAPILVLQVSFIGAIEFDKKRLWFFASLFESRVLFMTLEGEMGLLVGWGDDANFVVSVGGFNPRFNPPPLPFPTPRRIAIDMTISPVQRIRIEGYFAVTSNTVQFGAAAHLILGLDDFGIEGHIQFDALFQFSPFYFIIEISASVSLKAFGVGCFSIRLHFELEGPTPWRAHGTGSISLFFFDISADFDITWGESQDTTLEPIAVIEKLNTEFDKIQNWKAELPSANNLFVSLRKLQESDKTLILHPLGTLFISQRLIPLDIIIDKVGSEKPSDAKKFEITVDATTGLSKKENALESFAMAQFKNMDDATKLTLPAFEKQHAGLELSSTGAALRTSRMVRRIIRYEQIVIDNNYKRFANKFISLFGLLFSHFLNGNSVSKLNISQAYQTKVNPFGDDKIKVVGDRYAVASNETNQLHNTGKVYFDSHALAQDYMKSEIAKQPNLVERLHIIPQFEVAEF
jgi:hypothetical protein